MVLSLLTLDLTSISPPHPPPAADKDTQFKWEEGVPKGGRDFKECPSHLVEWVEAAVRPHLSVFLTLRMTPGVVGDATVESKWVRAQLKARGIEVLPSESVTPRLDRLEDIMSSIERCDAFLIFGTETYGVNTGNPMCSFNEFEKARDCGKTMAHIKMCADAPTLAMKSRMGIPTGNIWREYSETSDFVDWLVSALPVHPPRVIASAPTQSEWLPFRRRDFEVDALARELIARAGAHGLSWGRSLPPSESERIAAALPDALRVHFVCGTGDGEAMRLEIQEQLERVNDRITCTGSAEEVAATCEQAVDAATHVVVILTDTSLPDGAPWLESGSLAEQQLVHALRSAESGGKQSREIITIYDKPKGLDSTVFGLEGVASDAIKNSLWGHEALVFRSKSTAPAYERKSMINEIVRRMCSKKASIDHLIADPPPLLPAATTMRATDGVFELKGWLYGLGMGEYESNLRDEGFDSIISLRELEKDDLKEIGITKLGHRKAIIKAITAL